MTKEKRAKEQIEAGASVLFAHALYKRPTLANCKRLARRVGVPIVMKLPSAQQRLVERYIRSSFASNSVKPVAAAAVQWFARQVAYVGTYVTPLGKAKQCFVFSEHEEDIVFPSYFNRVVHDDALHNERCVQTYLRELEDLAEE